MSETQENLYERLGGAAGIHSIVENIWSNHISNPLVKNRYEASDPENVKRLVREFFSAGIGGPETYTGRDMLAAHKGMNINDEEFVAVIDDVLKALGQNDVGQKEKDEVLCILYSMKAEIAHV
jgi:hemoglobin